MCTMLKEREVNVCDLSLDELFMYEELLDEPQLFP